MSTSGHDPRITPATGSPGGLGKRAGARFIDWIIAGAIGLVVFWLLDRSVNTPDWVSVLPGAGFGFLYFLFFEVLTGETPGKKILGLQVRGSGGAAKPSIVDSAKRNAYMLLNLIPCVGGLLWFVAAIYIAVTISSSPTKQGWHDKFAGGTQVVDR
ncbi:RDD family protein [Nocardia sp. NPDC057353]|uniref:RDD family protein n=1 Tax=Nocardia sp. NPDC057353 TaxID=3346104 RepID=UPI003632C84E